METSLPSHCVVELPSFFIPQNKMVGDIWVDNLGIASLGGRAVGSLWAHADDAGDYFERAQVELWIGDHCW
jgi:hypothetical protein